MQPLPIHLPRSDSSSISTHSDEVASHVFKSDIFLRIAMTILPITAVLTYQIDAIWQLQVHNTYAGLSNLRTIQDTIFISSICIYKIRSYNPLICIQHKALFNVISRLEVILAILVPIFAQEDLIKRTVANISLFILYDFISVYYHLFTLRLKWALWLFVVFITISVVNEWLYFVNHQCRLCDQISTGFEFLAECACCLVILWQFKPLITILPTV
ncbi:unnamed protein product [Adineta steineri]|uniref:Transmembrane protein n=1 Tax=Adineta steineri TaxID=433720 RepID=A0A818K4G9_9BILA|nr:unnamed protein product [Adineta steineri]CAF3545596.1 unnamed protein product [Adineta steineri]